jgi:hypothetical protein
MAGGVCGSEVGPFALAAAQSQHDAYGHYPQPYTAPFHERRQTTR